MAQFSVAPPDPIPFVPPVVIQPALTEARRLSAAEVGQLLGRHPRTIRKWARLGLIPCVRRRKKVWFVLADIQRWEAKGTTGKL